METKNISDIESKVQAVFTEQGYSHANVKSKLTTTRTIIRIHKEKGEEYLRSDIVEDYINHQKTRYQSGEISRNLFLKRKKTAEYLVEIHNTGTINHTPCIQLPDLPDYFVSILSNILANDEWNQKYRKKQYTHAKLFLEWLYTHGHNDLSCTDECVVREYLTECSARMIGVSLKRIRDALKVFFLFLSEDGILSAQMNRLFLFRIPIDKKIKPFMSHDEIAAVLNIIDRTTAKGKRDYAIIILAAITGLRGCDIAELTLDCIDWRNGEIRIV